MAESLLLPWVQGLVGKAADVLVQIVTSLWGVDDHRSKLERQLKHVRYLLADAEEKAETGTEAGRAIKAWMKKLRAAAYEADDVLDELRYEALRHEVEARGSTSRKRKYFLLDQPLVLHKLSTDLTNVLRKIDELVVEMNNFGLLQRIEKPQIVYHQTHSALDESLDIFGRDNDREVVVNLLLDKQDQQNVQVLPIIGMGGLGKTTLAKMVFNDSRVQKHFELKMWHCVSENFEATAIVRSVIELATNKKCDLPDNIELLRGELQKVIGRKRYLLILDDVWNEEQQKWEDSLKPLLCSSVGGLGSMIVVTSRSRQVASIMGTLPHHELPCLSEDDSWGLFSERTFSNEGQMQAELVTIGKRIVKKCKGVPLALKTMGGLMSSMHQVHEWETVAASNIGDTVRGKNEMMSILKLSYRHLSPELKQCFAFCAVFPKDYEMEKDKLIQLWIANGFILEDGIIDLEKKGEHIFNELVWRSFLQDVNLKSVKYWTFEAFFIVCKMHDLMHDLAKDMSAECVDEMEVVIKEDVLHMKISYGLEDINVLLKSSSSLRTLLINESKPEKFKVSKPMPLRALCCHDLSFIHRQVVNPAHLRYLEISNTQIDRLPDAVCMLYNLISLRLNGCLNLQYLPKGMVYLRKLMHLYLLDCIRLQQMPPKLSLLHGLCILTMFVVGTEDGCGIEELKNLRHLSHRLELYKLRNVKIGSKANLHQKRISELLLDWDHISEGDIVRNDEPNSEAEVLESLVPPSELEVLEIRRYHGLAISQWMRDPQMFQCLRELIISSCPRCEDIPIVWLSSSLENVSLSGMDSLTTLCKNIEVEDAEISNSQVFPRLKNMTLNDMPNLERWIESSVWEPHQSVMFPQLEELRVYGCSKLATLPEAPLLMHLTCMGSHYAGVRPMSMPLGCWPSLVSLNLRLPAIANVATSLEEQQGQSQTPLKNLQAMELMGEDAFISIFNLPKLRLGLGEVLACLEELKIWNCYNIVRWPVEELRYLRCLRSLFILGFEKIEQISSKDMLSLPMLQTLDIHSCNSLRDIQELPTLLERVEITNCKCLVALPSNLGNLAKLRVLVLSDCGGLEALPDGMDGLTSLEDLNIWRCPRIEEFPCGLLLRLPHLKELTVCESSDGLKRRCREGGEYFDLLSSIPSKSLE